ncbi:hypothetical protein [Salmonella bongori]|uniref:hypothetical protein n=1 Tax=Salmonella bongori TaxID=54736 RepID=UPI001EE65997|nr:hypothetical protein [Salmonella bongori]
MSDNKTLPEIDNNAFAELDKVKIMGRVAVEARIALGVELLYCPSGARENPTDVSGYAHLTGSLLPAL